ncbi:MAG TPA: metalloregulator ArsR/SmtB family transcription factor [Candidatus Baltobacteraceae bacterium]|jgi:DNA-binding transcriptional ArsR family regulator|nr:metalloregulator ArsR/SmtB family transcription factor [Candidatus Baltobacteraceae bacterium]
MVNSSDLDAVFAALSDPTRRRILERLARRPLTVGEIAAEFAISQPGISKHVRVLEACGLLNREVEGRFHRCTLAPEPMAAASAWIEKQRSFWNATLDRLDIFLHDSAKRKKRT